MRTSYNSMVEDNLHVMGDSVYGTGNSIFGRDSWRIVCPREYRPNNRPRQDQQFGATEDELTPPISFAEN